MTTKNVIFDWSGVLCDDIIGVYSTIMEMHKEFGIGPILFQDFQEKFELPWDRYWTKVMDNPPSIDKLRDIYLILYPIHKRPRKIEGAHDVLLELKEKHISMFILSSSNFAKEEYKELYNDNLMTHIEFGCFNKHDGISSILKKYHLNPKETAFVGDMDYDIKVGKKARVTSIAVLGGYQKIEQLEKAKPDYIIKSLSDLPKIISSS